MCLAVLSISTYANEVKPTKNLATQKAINYQIDGKNYTQIEFDKLAKEQPNIATKPCTITVVVEGSYQGVPFRFEREETFEASWFGCLIAQVTAFLLEILT